MKQTKIETGYGAQLLHRIRLEVLVDRNLLFLKTAKALGPAIALPLLGRADEVIE